MIWTIPLVINQMSYSCTLNISSFTRQCSNRFKVRRKFLTSSYSAIHCVYSSEKNYENRSIFARVITKI